jgi:hypothetical protein
MWRTYSYPGLHGILYVDFDLICRLHHIAGDGLQNLGLHSVLRAFKQGGVFIVPHLLWHGTSVFPVSYEGYLNLDIHKTSSAVVTIKAFEWHRV